MIVNCANCGVEIKKKLNEVKKSKSGNVFCSRSCSCTTNNRNREDTFYKEYSKRRASDRTLGYENYIRQWLAGVERGWVGEQRRLSKNIRTYLHKTRGTACEKCGWDEKHPVDGLVLTQIDHIDGDAENCRPENLQILCPNCHSMTPTFMSRNKNSFRLRLLRERKQGDLLVSTLA